MSVICIQINNENDMIEFGKKIAQQLKIGTTLFLHGALGAGKTTLTRGILRGFGYNERVKSPTYTIVEPYIFDHLSFYHFDLYRLNDPNELSYIGIKDYFTETSICVIEWPEKGGSLIPKPDVICHIDFTDEGRILRIEAPESSFVIE